MAGVRNKPMENGKYQGWFIDMHGNRKFFTGTKKKTETKRMAEKFEDDHRQVRLGYRDPPKSASKHKKRPFEEVRDEYLEWGESQGGRGGRPWGQKHALMRTNQLEWWRKKLGLKNLGDVYGILPKVENALRELQRLRKAGKTLMNYAESLRSFCNWCVNRGYLEADPLKNLERFDVTPITKRRAMTALEIKALLKAAPEERRLLYEIAFTTGLRATEISSLKVSDLNEDLKALNLHAEWTKNRKNGLQPLTESLLKRLKKSVSGKAQDDPLIYVPSHPAREMDKDLEAAKIPKWTPEGKVDFHACRTAYITFILESGADLKTAQSLARHSTPNLTMNTYGRARRERLYEVTETIGEIFGSESERAKCVQDETDEDKGDDEEGNNISSLGRK